MIRKIPDMSQSNGNADKIIADNMILLSKRRAICDEQRRLSLTQFIDIARGRSPVCSIADAAELYGLAKSLDGELSCEERIFVCQLISADEEFRSSLSSILLNSIEEIPKDAHGRIAYVKNKQNDDAFLKLAATVKSARAFYASTFSDCCEAVFDGKCEYCILPIENSDGGKLYSFYGLIDKYELKIHSALRCGAGETQNTMYALISKSLSPAVIEAPFLRFEFTVICGDDEYVDDIVSALRYLCCDTHSLATEPVEYDHQKQKYFFSVDVSNENLIPLIIYIENEYPRYTPMGLYKVNKEN